jgi:hypothetical protein
VGFDRDEHVEELVSPMDAQTPEEKVEAAPKSAKPRPNALRTLRNRFLSGTFKILRLTSYLAFVAMVLTLVAARLAWAHAKDVVLSTGEDLSRLTESGKLDGVYRLKLNGESVNIASATTQASPDEVLDRFQAECEQHADGIGNELANLRASIQPGAKPVNEGFPGAGVLRTGNAEAGTVACFALGSAVGRPEMFERITAFARVGDLGKIGFVRHITARKTASGSHVAAMWTDGSLNVVRMFPETGDAPGSDMEGIPRPPSSRRIFTAYAEGAPYALRLYESTATPEAVFTAYAAEMPRTGWRPVGDVAKETPNTRAYARLDVDVMLVTEIHDGKTMVSVIEMGGH